MEIGIDARPRELFFARGITSLKEKSKKEKEREEKKRKENGKKMVPRCQL